MTKEPRQFFNDHVGFAIERDRLEKSTRHYPFDHFEERTPATATRGDVMDAVAHIKDPQDARTFIAGYAEDLHETHGFSVEQAVAVAAENLSLGISQEFTDTQDRATLSFWEEILSAQ